MSLFEVLLKEEKKVRNPEKLRREIDANVRDARKEIASRNYRKAASLFHDAADTAHRLNERAALEYTLEAAKLFLKEKDYFNTGWEFRNASLIMRDWKDYHASEEYIRKAIGIFSSINRNYAAKWCYNLLGEVLEERGDIYGAFEAYKRSMEIQNEDEIRERMETLAKKLPHLFVYPEAKEAARKGDDAKFLLVVKNISEYAINDISVRDGSNRKIGKIGTIHPEEEKTLKASRKMGGESMESPFETISYTLPDGRRISEEIRKIEVRPKTNIGMDLYLKGRPGKGSSFFLVALVSNPLKSDVTDLVLRTAFPRDFIVQPLTGFSAKRIGPGKSRAFVFRIVSLGMGSGTVTIEAHYGKKDGRTAERLEAVANEIGNLPENVKIKAGSPGKISPELMQKLARIQRGRLYLRSIMRPLPASIPEKNMKTMTNRITLDTNDTSLVIFQLLEQFDWLFMDPEPSDSPGNFHVAGKSVINNRALNLRISVREEKGKVSVEFKGYSDTEEELEKMLPRFAEILSESFAALSGSGSS